MQTYTQWREAVKQRLRDLHVNVFPYAERMNLHGLYNVSCSVEQGADAVLEVAARHGNVDAEETLKERERRGI